MEKIYSNINRPAGLASVQKLYKAIKKTNKKIKLSDVKRFLSSQESYTLHRTTRKRFPRRKFIFKQPGETLISDIAYFAPCREVNKQYFLFLIDGYIVAILR